MSFLTRIWRSRVCVGGIAGGKIRKGGGKREHAADDVLNKDQGWGALGMCDGRKDTGRWRKARRWRSEAGKGAVSTNQHYVDEPLCAPFPFATPVNEVWS